MVYLWVLCGRRVGDTPVERLLGVQLEGGS